MGMIWRIAKKLSIILALMIQIHWWIQKAVNRIVYARDRSGIISILIQIMMTPVSSLISNSLVGKEFWEDPSQKEILIKVVGLMVNIAEASQGILALSNSSNCWNILMIYKMEISAWSKKKRMKMIMMRMIIAKE